MTYAKPSPTPSVPSTRRRHPIRAREWPRPPRRDPHTRLIAQLLGHAGPDSSVIATSSRPWASATFVGARHTLLLRLGGTDHGEQADRLMVSLPEAEFAIAGHIVADLCVDERLIRAVGRDDEAKASLDGGSPVETILRLSILTIEEW